MRTSAQIGEGVRCRSEDGHYPAELPSRAPPSRHVHHVANETVPAQAAALALRSALETGWHSLKSIISVSAVFPALRLTKPVPISFPMKYHL
jgi:hypothetical protein